MSGRPTSVIGPQPADGPSGRPLRVVVADDQTVVRDGLVVLLGLLPDVEVVGAAADGAQAVDLVAEHQPDVVLMDLRMPRCDGVEATRRIRDGYPGVQVVVLTTYADDDSIFTALDAGARGYLTKDATATEIATALRTVTAGHALLDPAVQQRLIEAMTNRRRPATTTNSMLPDGLTAREGEVLTLIAAGLSNAEIAAALVVTEATVKTHINHLLAKTRQRDRAQAVAYAYRHGLADRS
ncbi:response regulator transcription factor [Pseudonocardia sp.]|jgi:DNA-binding NarL/FixJ family response regulator|uniref:response regulator transcription factor n=1 Tax=Pseudonocardia sp. TaxID=60912 RepID=UPI0031FD919D